MSLPAPPASVLVVVTRQIGDVLLTTPLVHRARELWPGARIDVLGFEGTLGMLQGNPDIDSLLATPKRLGLGGALRLARRLWRRYDLALVAEISDRAHLIAWFAARQRIGLLPAGHPSNSWKRRLLTRAVESEGNEASLHVVQDKLRLLEAFEPPAPPPPRVVPPPATALPADIEAQLAKRPVVMHVPSMWPYKQWAPDKFREVAAALLARGHQVVLTGTAGERDQTCIAPLRDLSAAPGLLDVSGQLDLGQVANLLSRAALYIGPDTSVSHLAASTGVPTLVVFGPTNPQRWAPWPVVAEAPVQFHRRESLQVHGNVSLVQATLPCVPCSRAGCEDHNGSRSDCLAAIGAPQVLARALEILGGA